MMKTSSVQFQKARHKNVGGVMDTRYTLLILIVSEPEKKWLSLKSGKSNKHKSEDYIQTTCPSSDHEKKKQKQKKTVQFQQARHGTVGGVVTTYTLIVSQPEKNDKAQNGEKVIKNYLRNISKSHAHFQTITKTSVQFQNDRHETVGGVTDTSHILSEGAELHTTHKAP